MLFSCDEEDNVLIAWTSPANPPICDDTQDGFNIDQFFEDLKIAYDHTSLVDNAKMVRFFIS